jgi:hypothetical protein
MRYKAFLSYCHADESWAAWLHKSLESYRVPKRLVGRTGLHGTVPSRLTPIFRDRDELSSGTDLDEKIKEALADSESLLVICSPNAAQSRWVNEEIRHFRSLGREKRIYCVIVDGDPQASDPKLNCFPATLLEHEGDRLAEPMAADVRKWADGKSLAKLKLVAGVLGVRLDELRQREQQRKWKLQAFSGIALLAVAALVLFSIQSRVAEKNARQAREAQQVAAESMLAGFLEQSNRLGDVADIDTRKAFGEVLSGYLADLDPADLTLESRRQLGVVLLNQGVILRDEGQLDDAMNVFMSAREILQLLVNESRGDAEALFELSQVEYWIGQVHLDLGRMQEAGVSFKAYADASTALHALEPENADWTMEAAYAQSNLGNLEQSKSPSDPQLTLQYHKAALELNEEAGRQDKKFEQELAESHANVADAWLGACGLPQAMENRLKNVELAARHQQLNTASNNLKMDFAYALSGLFRVQLMTGQLDLAEESNRQTLELNKELVEEDPNNLKKRWNLLRQIANQALLLELSGKSDQSWSLSLSIEKDMTILIAQEQTIRIDYGLAYSVFLRDFASRAYRKGERLVADRLLEESNKQLAEITSEHPDSKYALFSLAKSYFYYWEQNDFKLPNNQSSEWLSGAKKKLNLQGCSGLDTAARISILTAEKDEAQAFTSQLLAKGYREPEFIRFCSKYGLCNKS